MKITANSIGNYGPGYTPAVKPQQQVHNPQHVKVQQVKTQESLTLQATEKTSLSAEEKDFFVNLYPQNKNEIVDYHFYQRSGKMAGVAVGSLFDRRG